MRRKGLALTILAIFLLTTITPPLAKSNVDPATIHQKALQYLTSNYNSSVHLISETNDSNIYWLVSDNLLSYYALRNDDQTISNEIAASLKDYVISYNLPHDANGLPTSFKHEAVIGDILLEQSNDSITYNLTKTENPNVKIEIANGNQTDVWQNYADWLALRGISLFNSHQYTEAKSSYYQLMGMWKGNGFADGALNFREENPSTIEYDTYKLGLALILVKDLQIENTTFTNQCLRIFEQSQLSDGGMQTYYNYTSNGQFDRLNDSTNAETTSIISIRTESVPAEVTETNSFDYAVFVVIAVSIIIVAMALLMKAMRRN
jgi:hypothetical protein